MKRWLLLPLLLAGCREPVQNAPKVGDDIKVQEFLWRVRDAETINREHGPVPGHEVLGYIGQRADGSYVITTPAPRLVNDQAACILGHEVMHLAFGNYHN